MNSPIDSILAAAILAAQERDLDPKTAAVDAAKAYVAGSAAYITAIRQEEPEGRSTGVGRQGTQVTNSNVQS